MTALSGSRSAALALALNFTLSPLSLNAEPGPAAPLSEPEVQAYGETLASLRAEVDTLSGDLEDRRAAHQAELRSLKTQQAEVELQVRREALRLQQLEQAIAAKQAVVDAEGARSEALRAPLFEAMDGLDASITQGLPYRVQDRQDAVQSLRAQLEAGTLSPQETSSRLWQAIEDELRLTRENILDRQVIDLRGEERLVEVARLGMVALYFRTEDGEVGRAARAGSGYSFLPYDDPEDIAQVQALFDALQKQIRTGFFVIPNPLPEAAR